VKYIAHLTFLALNAIAALVGAGIGLDMTTTSDGVAFAGAGILLLMIPGAVLGLIGGYIAYFRQDESTGFASRAGVSLLVSAFTALVLTGATIQSFDWIGSSPKPDFVYIEMPRKTQITLASEAVIGQAVPFRAEVTIGSKRIPYDELPQGSVYSTSPSPQYFYPRDLKLLTAPAGRTDVRYNEVTGEGTVTFTSPGRYRVWVGRPSSEKVQGNVATITVRSSENVYVPAADYDSRVEIEFPAEVVVDEPFTFRVKRSAGPWMAVPPTETNGARYFPELPSARDSGVLGPLSWPKAFRVIRLNPATGVGEGVFSAAGQLQVQATLQDRVLKRTISSNSASVHVLSWQQDVDRHQGTNLPTCPTATPELLKWANAELAKVAECGRCRILSMRGLQEVPGEACMWLPSTMDCSGARAGPCQSIADDVMTQARARFNLEEARAPGSP